MIADEPSTPLDGQPPKTILICPECGHENDIAGDWIVRGSDDGQRYDCPECDTTITKRHSARPTLVH